MVAATVTIVVTEVVKVKNVQTDLEAVQVAQVLTLIIAIPVRVEHIITLITPAQVERITIAIRARVEHII